MLTRRKWLKSSLAACGSVPLLAGTADAKNAAEDNREDTFDVVVLGAGTGGLVTAIEAHDLGLKPIVLEKMDYAAGNSLYASGGIAAWGTKQQNDEGHPESREAFEADMKKVSENRADPELIRTYVENIGEDFEWLKNTIGVKFEKLRRKPWPIMYRMHNVAGDGLTGGARLVRYLMDACVKRNIPVLFNVKAMELITNDDFRIVGVKTVGDSGKKNYFAKDGVVVATGGFSACPEMMCRYMGGALSRLVLRGSPYVTGDNITLTAPLGARLVHMDQFHCGPIVEETHANPNFVIDAGQGIDVNVHGERFMDEVFTYTQKSLATATKTRENLAYHVIDSHWERAASAAKKFLDMKTNVLVADSPEELAEKMGIQPKVLTDLFAEFNQAVKNKELHALTPPCSLNEPPPLTKAPYYAFPFQGGITATFGGPKINVRAQVMTYEDRPVKGLYAVGNAAGGLFYGNYIGGSQLGGALVFGRIAARDMASKHQKA